jgi:hypothetical protein
MLDVVQQLLGPLCWQHTPPENTCCLQLLIQKTSLSLCTSAFRVIKANLSPLIAVNKPLRLVCPTGSNSSTRHQLICRSVHTLADQIKQLVAQCFHVNVFDSRAIAVVVLLLESTNRQQLHQEQQQHPQNRYSMSAAGNFHKQICQLVTEAMGRFKRPKWEPCDESSTER